MNYDNKEKRCCVCGDKALGYNFNAITCESCKAFFRRNALKNKVTSPFQINIKLKINKETTNSTFNNKTILLKYIINDCSLTWVCWCVEEFKCFFNNNCVVDMVTRRFCQKCRLRKCLEIGMKKEYIMSDEEKKAKRAKIEYNRQKRQMAARQSSNPPRLTMPLEPLTFFTPNTFVEISHEVSPFRRISSPFLPKIPYADYKPPDSGVYKPSDTGVYKPSDSGVYKPSDSGVYKPSDSGVYKPSDSGVYKPSDSGVYKPSDSGVYKPSDSGVYKPSDSGVYKPSDSGVYKPSDSGVYKPSDSGVYKPSDVYKPEDPSKLPPEQDVPYRIPGSQDQTDKYRVSLENKGELDHQAPSRQSTSFQLPYKQPECKQAQETQVVPSCSFINEPSTSSGPSTSSQEISSKTNNPCSQGNLLVYRLLFETNDMPMTIPAASNPKNFNQNSTETNQRLIGDVERIKLNELVMANEIMKQPLTCGSPDPSLTSVLNMTNYAIRRLIKMSKRISSFRSLCQADQIALLKGGCCELLILRSVMSYEPEKECWKGPEGPKVMSIKVDVLKKAGGTVYEQHKKFIMGFSPKWKSDENIMLLLSAITLFSPDRPHVIHKEVIKLEQDVYSFLLQRYLHTIYPTLEAISAYRLLSQKLEQLHSLNENHVEMFMETNLKEIEPLLIEIFDLKF
ncbi:Hr96 [Cordylochernes scorpioides]|uniref:Hr96 n=1 Tax=Cordylochernes scorpioides TaxID=51811 RepID=A0ABY6K569_9ARAC|nr:Hr96 [Cordylochernes scorpioides]